MGCDRRLGIERRQFTYSVHIPERRICRNRRSGKGCRRCPERKKLGFSMQTPVRRNIYAAA